MSFRIEDILRDTTRVELKPKSNILERTLSNSQESNLTVRGDSERFCGQFCYPLIAPYATSTDSLTVAYSPSPLWPVYTRNMSAMSFPCGHYTKRKGGQVRFTATQTEQLETRFKTHKYLSPDERRALAESLKLSDRQVKTWFQNRRAKWRRCKNTKLNSDKDLEQTTCDTTN